MTWSDALVTPEAVVLELPAAGIGSRSLAKLLDVLIIGAIMLVVLIGGAALGGAVPEWLGITLVLVLSAALTWGYPTAFETLLRGQTPGKAALGVRVVTREGGQVRFRHAAIRAALGLVELVATIGGLAVVTALVTRPPRRLGDLAAGTFVVAERTPGGSAEAMRFEAPAEWRDYAARLDVGALDPTAYAAVRTALRRARRLTPDDAEAMLGRVAAAVSPRVAPSPPSDIGAGAFLTCVAAVAQRHAAEPGSAAPPGASPPGAAPPGAGPPAEPRADANSLPPPPDEPAAPRSPPAGRRERGQGDDDFAPPS